MKVKNKIISIMTLLMVSASFLGVSAESMPEDLIVNNRLPYENAAQETQIPYEATSEPLTTMVTNQENIIGLDGEIQNFEQIKEEIDGTVYVYYKFDDFIQILYFDTNDQIVNIPNEIRGLPVKHVNLTNNIIPYLQEVNIPKNVIGIEIYNRELKELKSINVDPENEHYTSIDGVLYTKDVKTLLCYPQAKIGDEFIIPNTVESIADYSFNYSLVKKLTIPDKVVDLLFFSTNYFPYLEEINVSEQHEFFSSENGVLFNKDKSILFYYPVNGADVYEVPNSVEEIMDYAFAYNSRLKNVTVPSSLKRIGNYAFYNCAGLSKLELTSDTIIGYNAFEGSPENLIYNTGDLKYLYRKAEINGNIFYYQNFDSNNISVEFIVTTEDTLEIPSEIDGGIVRVVNLSNSFENVELERLNLNTLILPKTLEKISLSSENLNVKEIVISNESENYSTENGVLYDKTKESLVYYPNQKQDIRFIMPNTVKYIWWDALYNNYLTKIVLSDNLEYKEVNDNFNNLSNLSEVLTGEDSLYYTTENGIVYDKQKVELIKAPLKCTNNIVIPEGVKSIRAGAFVGNKLINTILFPLSLESIGEYAFAYCENLERLDIGADVKIGYNAFEGCPKNVEYYVDPGEIIVDPVDPIDPEIPIDPIYPEIPVDPPVEQFKTLVGNDVFYYNKVSDEMVEIINIYSEDEIVDIPEKIDDYTVSSIMAKQTPYFENCTVLNINSNTCNINSNIKYWWKNLKAINVSNSNELYSSVDGVLYNKEKTELIIYPAGKEEKEYVVEATVKRIADGAFANAENLVNVKLNDDLEYIGAYSFANCYNLSTLNLPLKLNKIYSYSFQNCYNLNNLSIHENITEVESGAFWGCSNLSNVNINEDTKVEYTAFQKTNVDISILNRSEIPLGYADMDGAEKDTTLIYGDINLDGNVDNLDLVVLCRYLVKEIEFNEEQKLRADMVPDGTIDIADLMVLKQYVSGGNVKLGK